MTNKLSEHSRMMEKFRALINREKECAASVDPGQTQWSANLDAVTDRTKETFTVLVMGSFSSGKTTMINALIGERLLPESVLPTTAVMTELKYSETKKIIMYPKEGTNVDGKGDQPFTVPATTESIERYVTIDNEAGVNSKPDDSVKIASQFEKMELYWPLDILKDGVTIVDSPGLNDPYSNDVIVKNYLPHADAIIYAMPSTSAYTGQDFQELTSLNNYRIDNIIIAYTYWDRVRHDGEKEASRTRNILKEQAKKHTSLGDEAIHFLASREGLRAKIEKDRDLLVKSGYYGFYNFLADYLVNGRGKDKVKNLVGAIESEAELIRKHAIALNVNATRDSAEIAERMDRARKDLADLEVQGKQINDTFALKLQTKRPVIENKSLHFLPTLKDTVDLNNFTPETKIPSGFAALNPFGKKEIARKIKEEVEEEYKRRMEQTVKTWMSTELSDTVKAEMQDAAKDVSKYVESFSDQLNNIDATIGIQDSGKVKTGRASSIALGVAFALLTGDYFTGSSIAIYGKNTALRQLGFQAAYGAAVGIAVFALGATISFPVFVLGGIVASLVAIITNNGNKSTNKLKKEILTKLTEENFGPEGKLVSSINEQVMASVDALFEKAESDLKAAIDFDIETKQNAINAVIQADQRSKEEKEADVECRKKALNELDSIVEDAITLQSTY